MTELASLNDWQREVIQCQPWQGEVSVCLQSSAGFNIVLHKHGPLAWQGNLIITSHTLSLSSFFRIKCLLPVQSPLQIWFCTTYCHQIMLNKFRWHVVGLLGPLNKIILIFWQNNNSWHFNEFYHVLHTFHAWLYSCAYSKTFHLEWIGLIMY